MVVQMMRHPGFDRDLNKRTCCVVVWSVLAGQFIFRGINCNLAEVDEVVVVAASGAIVRVRRRAANGFDNVLQLVAQGTDLGVRGINKLLWDGFVLGQFAVLRSLVRSAQLLVI